MPIDAILVGTRHRTDMGDIDGLANSIQQSGLLNPVTVTVDGRLVAGARRLLACRQLDMTTVAVTVAHNINDAITALTAERDENTCRKDPTPEEAVRLGRSLDALLPETPKGRPPENVAKKATLGRRTAAIGKAVGMSRPTYEKADAVVTAAESLTTPEPIRQVAERAKAEMNRTGNVDGAHQQVKAAEEWADAVAEFPALDALPEQYRKEALFGFTHLRGMDERQRPKSEAAFKSWIASRDPERDRERSLIDKANKAANDLWQHVCAIPLAVQNLEERLDDYSPDILAPEWPDALTDAVLALQQIRTALVPRIRRIK